MKIRARARKLGLVRGSDAWRAFLGLKEKVAKILKHETETHEFRVSVRPSSRPAVAKPIAEPPSVKIGKVTKEDRRPRPMGKKR
jgi:hypothetical protein